MYSGNNPIEGIVSLNGNFHEKMIGQRAKRSKYGGTVLS